MSDRIIKNLSSRLTVKFILLFITGIFTAEIYSQNFVNTFILSFTILSCFLLCILLKEKYIKCGLVLTFCLISYISGALYLNYANHNEQLDLRDKIGENLWLYGVVISSPKVTDNSNSYSVDIELNHCEKFNNRKEIAGKIKVYINNLQNKFPKVNDNVYFYTRILKTENFEKDFNYIRHLKTKNIYVAGLTNVLYMDTSSSSNKNFVCRIKYWGREINAFLDTKINELFSYDINALAVIKGIMLGNTEDFSSELTENFSKTGISHITAISGLHLNILVGIISGLLVMMRISRKYALFIVVPIILIFSTFIGFTPSVTRASVMLIITMFASILKRQYDSLTALFISALVILLYNPYILFSISFILSFVSTLSIIMLYPFLNEILNKSADNRFKFIIKSFCVSLSAFIGTAPVIAYYFNNISFFSLIANIWIIPLCSVVLVLGYVCLLVSLFLPAHILTPLLYPLATSAELIIKTTELTSSVPFLSVSVPKPSGNIIFLYITLIYSIYNFNKIFKTWSHKKNAQK